MQNYNLVYPVAGKHRGRFPRAGGVKGSLKPAKDRPCSRGGLPDAARVYDSSYMTCIDYYGRNQRLRWSIGVPVCWDA
jgi:hypothetical protein